MFVSSQLPVHMLRGVEPNLRYGTAIKNFIDKNYENNQIPKCMLNDDADDDEEKNYDNARRSRGSSFSSAQQQQHRHKCIHLASRKQIGDAIIRYEDKSIIHK